MLAEPDWLRLHKLAVAEFDFRVRQIQAEYWEASTPCEEWDVYDLVNHNVKENLWVPLLLAGTRADQVGGLSGDVITGDPEMVWEESWSDAVTAFSRANLDELVWSWNGEITVKEYICQRTCDLAIHAWDLAVGLGVDPVIDSELVLGIQAWSRGRQENLAKLPELYDPPIKSEFDADDQTLLLNFFGREV
ncbi:MAG: TIGR03086 family metal-binding protein [Actinomycetota bacterium]|nr:TIGR03086 family metal-binding protein [Actinomycetota bacterium]MDG1488884.1 TIGR03086 family metal-binding protein [Actinomycetota bacterium]MDG2121204.1 TIGR03086 family metal-binding protein [Actinomycetota bacterium]